LSKLGRVGRYTEAGPGPVGAVMAVEFELNGQQFGALNGIQPNVAGHG
jgi:predicted 3-demethylubiquinone-9 3-methyltransferase (glyoxalase superfamily)